MRVAGPDRGEIPNFAVEVNSTIDISSGLGGSGAEAAAIALCFDVFGPCTGAKILKESKRKLVF